MKFDWAELTVRCISSIAFVVGEKPLPWPDGKGRHTERTDSTLGVEDSSVIVIDWLHKAAKSRRVPDTRNARKMAGVVSEVKRGTTSLHFNRENYLCCLRKSIWRGIDPCEENEDPFFSTYRLFSSCQTWWKVCAIFGETPRQVSYYTTTELKTQTALKVTLSKHNFSPDHKSDYPSVLLLLCHSFGLGAWGLFWQLKGTWTCHYSEWQLSELGLFVPECPKGTADRSGKGERLSKGLWSAANIISWCHVLLSLPLSSPY